MGRHGQVQSTPVERQAVGTVTTESRRESPRVRGKIMTPWPRRGEERVTRRNDLAAAIHLNVHPPLLHKENPLGTATTGDQAS